MKPKPARCRACPKPAREGSFYCSHRCNERWRRGERQRLYWCTRSLIDSGALAWDGAALVIVARVVLDESHTLRVVDALNGQPIPTRAARSELQNRSASRR